MDAWCAKTNEALGEKEYGLQILIVVANVANLEKKNFRILGQQQKIDFKPHLRLWNGWNQLSTE